MTDPAEQQAATASQATLAIWGAYEAGQVSRPDAEAAMAVAVFTGKVLASRLADITVSTLANRPPVGIVPGPQHVERLEQSVSTILDDEAEQDEQDPEDDEEALDGASERLDRLAVSETLVSHQKATRAAIEQQGFAQFQEVVAANACSLCQPFRDQLHPAADAWQVHHPNCKCRLVPVGEPEAASEKKTEREPHKRPRVTITRTS